MIPSLRERAYAALLAGAREAAPDTAYDDRGYAPAWEANLAGGLPREEIAGDLSSGAGRELDGKLCAAHSSAALAVNAFGPWRRDAAALRLGGQTGFHSLAFEAACATGLGGTPPHLDLLAEGELPVAVESKCTEWMETKPVTFSPSYDRLRPSHGHSPWFEQVWRLRSSATLYRFLDAAQLVKHALGLLTRYQRRDVLLVYLYWEPRNADDWLECGLHRWEAEDLAARVSGSNVRLVPMSYRELWGEWERRASAPHLPYLRTRYDREV